FRDRDRDASFSRSLHEVPEYLHSRYSEFLLPERLPSRRQRYTSVYRNPARRFQIEQDRYLDPQRGHTLPGSAFSQFCLHVLQAVVVLSRPYIGFEDSDTKLIGGPTRRWTPGFTGMRVQLGPLTV